MDAESQLKPLFFVGSARRTLQRFPMEVRAEIGFALFQAQRGGKHLAAKPMKGFGGASVLEVVEDFDGDTYRTVYTVRFARAIYVLHAFQKKAKTGIRTPQHDVALISERLKAAAAHYEEWSHESGETHTR